MLMWFIDPKIPWQCLKQNAAALFPITVSEAQRWGTHRDLYKCANTQDSDVV